MILVNDLRAMMVQKGYTQSDVAKMLGISDNTLTSRLKRGVFNSDEMYKLIDILDIKNPSEIFFAKEVNQ